METVGKRGRGRRTAVLIAAAGVLFVLFLASLTLGRFGVPLSEVVRILFHKLWTLVGLDRVWPMQITWTTFMENAIINVRLPRIVTAVL
ncbi:MAG: hypothetical protein IJK54_01165, partial [Clostridia bacterium]|nr:hypothetical protein [Clostridia bacterium]